MKPFIKEEKITVKVAYCPKCGQKLIEETDKDARTMWHYKCLQCGYKY